MALEDRLPYNRLQPLGRQRVERNGRFCVPRSAGEFSTMSKVMAKFIGTFWFVPGGCGSVVLAAGFPQLGRVSGVSERASSR